MSNTLVIVESPGKIKKLESFLGAGYTVMASVGHIRDLPEKGEGVAAPNYKPEYVVTKPDIVAKLMKAKQAADDVILASDPDREGEAIAFHLMEALGLKSPKRVVFNEITKSAVLAAVAKPRKIDDNLVHAQEARRVLDRLVGYRASSCLSDVVGQRLSAGRVQTPAVRLVVDREREILAFKVTDHYGVQIEFDTGGLAWQAAWKPQLPEGVTIWTDKAAATKVSDLREFNVTGLDKSESSRKPPAPFTTSTLQQAASIKLKMKPARTMELAQQLYQDGHISYHRTDTPNLSEEATGEVWKYLQANGMADYVPEKRNTWKSKEGSQEAHEGIRPTHFEHRALDIEDKDAAKLYELIWLRSVACQMKSAVFDVTTIQLQSQDEIDGQKHNFVATGRVQVFDGWLKLTGDDSTEEEAEDAVQTLPAIENGAHLVAAGAKVQEKKTKPPARFSEAALVKELEAKGIGRPSTYATIMGTILTRAYVAEETTKQRTVLIPTELGFKVIDALTGHFAFAELDYTRTIEADLDLIAEGKAVYKAVIAGVDNLLALELGKMQSAIVGESHPCECGGQMRRKPGPKGFFWGCSKWPECKNTLPDENGTPGTRAAAAAAPVDTTYPCTCGKGYMRSKTGPKRAFWGCSAWPECKNTLPDDKGKPGKRAPAAVATAGQPGHVCPKCGKPLRQLTAKQGKNAGNKFWGCSGFADGCKFSADDKDGKPVFKEVTNAA